MMTVTTAGPCLAGRCFAIVVMAMVATVVAACGGGDEEHVAATRGVEPSGESGVPSFPTFPTLNLEALSAERLRARRVPLVERNPFRFADEPSDNDDAALWTTDAPVSQWDESSPWESSPRSTAVDPVDVGPELVFLGVLHAPESAGRVAVVKVDGEVHHGRVGDVLASDYRVVDIETGRVDLRPLGGGALESVWMATGRP